MLLHILGLNALLSPLAPVLVLVSLIKFHILFSVGGHLHLKICELQLVVLILSSHTHVHAQHQPNRVLQSLWVIFTKCTTSQSCSKSFSSGSAAFDLFPLPSFFSFFRAGIRASLERANWRSTRMLYCLPRSSRRCLSKLLWKAVRVAGS